MSTFSADFLFSKAFRWVATATIAPGMFRWVAGATGIVGLSLGLIAPAQAQTAQLDRPITAQLDRPISRGVFNCMKDNNSNAEGRTTYSSPNRSGAESGQMALFSSELGGAQTGTVGYNFVITVQGRPATPATRIKRQGRLVTVPGTPATPEQGRLELNCINCPSITIPSIPSIPPTPPRVITPSEFLGRVRNGLQNTANTTCRGQ